MCVILFKLMVYPRKMPSLTLSHTHRRKRYVVLVSNGSFNPPTYMHLRCLGKCISAYIKKP
ncbi:hypothetical protein ACP275_05G115800 [Erythranthe tilingii]